VLSGTAASGSNGSYPLTITASNGVAPNATQGFTLTVNPAGAQAPSITSASGTTFTVGTAGTFTVMASGSPAPSFSETGALPSGVSFNTSTGVLSGTPASGSGESYPLTITASNGVNPNAQQSFTLTVNQAVAGAAASFVGMDTGTQGSWQGKYGADGYSIPTIGQSLPGYVNFSTAAPTYPWASSTTDVRALTLPGSSTRAATTWYSKPSFSFDVNITDGGTHQVVFYALDWDSYTGVRAETIQIVDASNPSHILDTETLSSYTGGTYLLWNISGHVTVNVTWTAGANATISGVFFGVPSQTAPLFTSGTSTMFVVGSTGSFTVTASGSPAPGFSETGALPSGVAFNTSTGVLSGTPASGSNGSYPLTITASNGVAPNATQGFTLTVNPAGTQAPSITSASSTTFTVGTAGTFTVMASGSPAPGFSETGALPSGVTFNTSTGVLSGTAASGSNGSYPLTITASNGVNPNAQQSFTLTVNPAGGGGGNGVTFVGLDTATQGNWQQKYGSDGYSIANANQSLPSYVSFAANNALLYTWAPNSSDVRALQLPNSGVRIASTWYNTPGISYDVNITDGGTHQVALYALDWDSYGGVRSETVQVVDANTHAVLDTESLGNYQNGVYLVWKISGHVTINVTLTTGVNAAISGVFFGGPATANFVGMDTSTEGNWASKYGTDGYAIPLVGQSVPGYASLTVETAPAYAWATSTSDARALQLPGGGGAEASTWYWKPTFDFDLNLSDGNTHQIALYALDWDSFGGVRSETIQIVDANSNAVLDTETLASFTSGTYAIWNISGHVKIIVTLNNGVNAVISGIFFK
jgi:hypothetical protein